MDSAAASPIVAARRVLHNPSTGFLQKTMSNGLWRDVLWSLVIYFDAISQINAPAFAEGMNAVGA